MGCLFFWCARGSVLKDRARPPSDLPMHARRPAHSSLAPLRRPSRRAGARALSAGVAQLAEHLFCKQVVGGSSPPASSIPGGLPERPKGAGCKPAGIAYVGSNPTPSTDLLARIGASASVLRSQPESSTQVFVCGGARLQATRPILSVRARRRARRLFVEGVASCADRDLAFQDSGLVSGSAGAEPIREPALLVSGSAGAEPIRERALIAAGSAGAEPVRGHAGRSSALSSLFSAVKPDGRGRVGGSPTSGPSILREIWGRLARGRKAVTMRGSSGMCAGEAFGGPPVSVSPAGVAQLVEHQPSKLNVEGSNPFSRSTTPPAQNGATARRIGWPT